MTMQRHDTLFYKDAETIIFSQPLEQYFALTQKPNFNSLKTSMISRGYFADWKIIQNKLFLIDFVGHQVANNWDELEYRLSDLFKDIEPPVFAEWFTGDIIIPIGENISTSIYPMFKTFSKLSFDKGQLITEIEVSPEDLTATNIGIAASGAGR